VLELIADAGLLWRRLAARSGWHIDIRFEGKSGHFERVEKIGSSQEILCLLLAV
jgi:hypothetical protein